MSINHSRENSKPGAPPEANAQNGHHPLPQTPLEVARHLAALGIRVTYPRRGTKDVFDHVGWQKDQLTPDDFPRLFGGERYNVSVLPGEASERLVDVDLDAPAAPAVAERVFPPTAMLWGRPGKPRSHRAYRLPAGESLGNGKGHHAWEDPDPAPGQKAMLLELRYSGHTVCAGSLWTDTEGDGHTEPITFTEDGGGVPVECARAVLLAAANQTAAILLLAHHWHAGARHLMTLPLAGLLERGGYPLDDALTLVTEVCRAAEDPDVANRLAAVRDTYAAAARGEPTTGRRTLIEQGSLTHAQVRRLVEWLGLNVLRLASADGYTLDDNGNADRFAEKFGEGFRYNHTTQTWFAWNGVIWAPDEKNTVQEAAKTIAVDLFQEALQLAREQQQSSRAKDLAKWARESGMEPHVTKLLKLARSIPRLSVVESELNADPVLLATPTGYLNLRTGAFTPPDRAALITRCTAAGYVPGASAPLWDATLRRFLPDEQQRLDFQTAMGYCLSGRGKEHVFVPWGGSKRGKSTLVSACVNALGTYGGTIGMETLATTRYPSAGAAREDLVALVGKRLVVASEATEHQRLNPALLKRLLGGSDKLSLRALYGRQFETLPTFGLWLLTNHQPKIPADDSAIWERLHVFPFNVYIPPAERDETERDKLVNPLRTGEAIVAWMVEGWWRYVREQHGRLQLPSTVEPTAEYRDAQDQFARFLEDDCVVGRAENGATVWCTFAALKSAFFYWRKDHDVREDYSDKRIAAALDERGFQNFQHPKTRVRCRWGVALRGDPGAQGWPLGERPAGVEEEAPNGNTAR